MFIPIYIMLMPGRGPFRDALQGQQEEKKYSGFFGKFEKRLDETFAYVEQKLEAILMDFNKKFETQQRKMEAKFNDVIEQLKIGNKKKDEIIELLKKIEKKK